MNTIDYANKFLDNAEQRGLSPHTLRWYRGILKPFGNTYPELPQEPEPIEEFIASFRSGDERRHSVYRTLRAFYGFLFDRFGVPNPMPKITAPKRSRKEKPTLSLDQLKVLLEYPSHKPMVRALLHLLADTGIRLGEAANMTRNDILDTGCIKVTGKTGSRIVPLSPMTRDLLIGIAPARTVENQRLFPHCTWYLGRLVAKAMAAAGLLGFSAHSLRHTFCTLYQGTDASLKYITGHSSWQMIEHYRHKKDAHAVEQHKRHSPLAVLYENGNRQQQTADAQLQTVIELAQELGAAKERIRYLEDILSQNPAQYARKN